MSLLKVNGTQTYKSKGGFKYPWAMEYFIQHDKMVWHDTDYDLAQDVRDYANASPEEKATVTSIMRLFVQNDVAAGAGYAKMLSIFKPTEIQLMLGGFNGREGTHVFNYANFIETVGLPDSTFSEFLDIPVMSTKIDYLEKAKVKKYEDYKRVGMSDADLDKEFRRAVARMVAVYAGGLEGTSLMAQFAMLLEFQFQGKYPGLCTIVEWSINQMVDVKEIELLETPYSSVNYNVIRKDERECLKITGIGQSAAKVVLNVAWYTSSYSNT